ncbi:MAG: BON domain-containing protein [Pirellulales bacterium]|nr:BON domain-containing protein [Pirellulales bacterium]
MSNTTRNDRCEVREALGGKMPMFLRSVNVERSQGRVRLSGAVRSFYHKQLAQETVRRVDGVDLVENELVVQA